MIWSRSHHSSRRRFFSTLRVSRQNRTGLIFGANTDVGKTVISAGLTRASLKHHSNDPSSILYMKPLQSGGSDVNFVRRYNPNLVYSKTLFEFDTPVSPHLASRLENKPVSDAQVLTALTQQLATTSSSSSSSSQVTWIETAGGVLSPAASSPLNRHAKHAIHKDQSWGWIPQADLYQPLLGQVQVILVGDGRLGGISCTLSAIESLIVRGYDIAAIVVIDGGNVTLEAVQEYLFSRTFALRSGSGEPVQPRLVNLPPLPPPEETLHQWYETNDETFGSLDRYLDHVWQGQVADLESLSTAGMRFLWWPFTQHQTIDQVTVIDSASGDYFSVLEHSSSDEAATSSHATLQRRSLFDACASWWTQGLGHGEASLGLASAAAAGRYGHVIFPQICHAPAVALAQTLVGSSGPGDGWAHRVFFSDDGSTAMEVAVKMGMKLYQKRVGITKDNERDIDWVVCAQEDCYHGDTLGVMNVAEPSIFNEGQHPWYEPKGLFLQTPTLGFRDGILTLSLPEGLFEPSFETRYHYDTVDQILDVRARMLTSLFAHYKEIIEMQWLVHEHSGVNRIIGSVVLETVLMGAGGMKFVDPLWQRALVDIAQSRNVPVIFDEIASGLYRLGVKSCREILKVDPDIACYAKLLTGGLLPMGVTLASEEVFDSFLGDDKGQALLHGHSYTAHPVGCVTAIQALDALDALHKNKEEEEAAEGGIRTLFDFDQVRELSRLPLVEKSFALGTVLAVTLKPGGSGAGGYAASSRTVPIVKKLRENGIYARPLGNVVYIMASPFTTRDECSRLTGILHHAIETFHKEVH